MRDCFPQPDTPISIAFPRGCLSIRDIRQMWLIASSKNTNSILLLEHVMLKSTSLSSRVLNNLFLSLISSYTCSSVSSFNRTEKITWLRPENKFISLSPLFQLTFNLLFNKSWVSYLKNARSLSFIKRSLKTRQHSCSQSLAKESVDVTDCVRVIKMPWNTLATSLKLKV